MKSDEKIQQKNKEQKEEHQRQMLEAWKTLKPFKTENDVPFLPKVDEKLWNEFFVPTLINAGAIGKKDLLHNHYYFGNCRNANVAKWDNDNNVFIIKSLNNFYNFL